MRQNVMTRAWEIARDAAAKFGGKASQYIALALKDAWAEVKGIAKIVFKDGMTLDIQIGPCEYHVTLNRWTKYGKDRVYLNDGTRSGAGYVDLNSRKAYTHGRYEYMMVAANLVLEML